MKYLSNWVHLVKKMIIRFEDFNSAEDRFIGNYPELWVELSQVLKDMPLYLKASDQAGIQGKPIFDPVGTNEYIKRELSARGWHTNIPIPDQFNFLGTAVDYGKSGVLVEAQFSNYPFLLNNTIRSEFFYKAGIPLGGDPKKVVVIITKAHMFPASNSTLYFEQAYNQLTELSHYNVFDVPIRLVGLSERRNEVTNAIFTKYENPRYSRTVVSREEVSCRISRGRTARSRCDIIFLES